uniref:Transmembrane protein 72 n=1 Tax=Chelydra serpentina TaxID=8475 RepID=A0A8C3XTW2_CHESE
MHPPICPTHTSMHPAHTPPPASPCPSPTPSWGHRADEVGLQTHLQGSLPPAGSTKPCLLARLLPPCYQPGSLAHTFWKRTTQPASFQKFLGYVLLSVACFLHPVLVWHVTIPGSMLVLTGLAYFLLSKRKKSPACREAQGPLEQYVDPCATAATSTGSGDTEQTFTFPGGRREQRASLLGHMKSILKGSKDKGAGWPAEPAPAPPTTALPAPGKQVHFQEKLVRIIPSISESPDEAESEAEETTSDTAPILGPTETPLFVTPLSATGLF